MKQAPSYKKSLGLLSLVSLGVGGTIGSGIFVVPGIAAKIMGPASLIAWLIVAISASTIFLSLAYISPGISCFGRLLFPLHLSFWEKNRRRPYYSVHYFIYCRDIDNCCRHRAVLRLFWAISCTDNRNFRDRCLLRRQPCRNSDLRDNRKCPDAAKNYSCCHYFTSTFAVYQDGKFCPDDTGDNRKSLCNNHNCILAIHGF